MPPLRITAPAKLNLFLHITGRRPDGYHLLESLVAFTEFGDTIEVEAAPQLSLALAGPYAGSLPPGDDNLVLRAARLLQRYGKAQAGARITLHKRIPVGAGLGGGSSDAAAALKALAALWKLPDGIVTGAMALSLGSDVPVCLLAQAAWVKGIGEQVTPVVLRPGVWAVLVNPGMPLLTAAVYKGFSGTFAPPSPPPPPVTSFGALIGAIEKEHNALQAPAVALLPVIDEVMGALRETPGCALARMSGSGATCFGLYEKEQSARAAVSFISRKHPAWWCMATRLMEP